MYAGEPRDFPHFCGTATRRTETYSLIIGRWLRTSAKHHQSPAGRNLSDSNTLQCHRATEIRKADPYGMTALSVQIVVMQSGRHTVWSSFRRNLFLITRVPIRAPVGGTDNEM